MPSRILFLCARGSGRALLAVSLFHSVAADRFEIGSTPLHDAKARALVEAISREQSIALLSPDHLTQPTFGLQWDEGIILSSGLTAT